MRKHFLLLIFFLGGCAPFSLREYTYLRDISRIKTLNFNPYNWVCTLSGSRYPDITFLINGNIGLTPRGIKKFSHPFLLKRNGLRVPKKIFALPSGKRLPSFIKGIMIESIVVDPGHGGRDPGAIGRGGLREKDVVLDISLRLARILKRRGIKVTLTRREDKFLSLKQRSLIANQSGAQLFLSIHANASRRRSRRGFEVYYYSRHPSGEEAYITQVLENSVLRYEDNKIKGSILRNILWDLVKEENKVEALRLASYFCDVFNRRGLFYIRGIKSASFYVLRNTLIPALLLEVGYISNPYEEKMLKNLHFREEIAESIAEAILSFNKDFGEIVVRR